MAGKDLPAFLPPSTNKIKQLSSRRVTMLLAENQYQMIQ